MTTRYACPACRQPVRWAVTVNAKRLALDPDPDPDGNQAAYRDGTGTLRTRQLRKDEAPLAYERRYMPHTATCTRRQPPPPKPAPLAPNVIPISRAATRRTTQVRNTPR